jgi:hypothetical protein
MQIETPLPLRERASNIRGADVARVRGLAPIGANDFARLNYARLVRRNLSAALLRGAPLITRPFSRKGRKGFSMRSIESWRKQ